MTDKEKYIGEAKMREKPNRALKFIIGDKSIKARHLDDGCITPQKLDSNVKDKWLNPILDTMFIERILPLLENLQKSDASIDE